MNQEYDNENRIVGWKRQSKNGNTYLSLIINVAGTEYRAALFAETEKKSDKSPDYTGKVHVDEEQAVRADAPKEDTVAPVTDKDLDEPFNFDESQIPF